MAACHVHIFFCMNLSVGRQFSARGSSPKGASCESCWRFSQEKSVRKSVWDSCLKAMCKCFSLEECQHWGLTIKIKWWLIFAGWLTTLEPCFVQARVRGGFPVQAQVKAASIPMSTVIGLGSDSSLGPTNVKQTVSISKEIIFRQYSPLRCKKKTTKKAACSSAFLVSELKLTLHIDQRADIGAAHGVGHLAGDWVGEVRIVHCHLKAVPIGLWDGHTSFWPPWK